MNTYKTYITDVKTFQEAFDAVYGQKVKEYETKQKHKKYQNEVDKAISYEMEKGLSRNEAIMKLYPNG